MKTVLKWFFLLNKRLYKKFTFIIIAALIPLLVISLNIVADKESGFVHVALAQQDSKDKISNEIINSLVSESQLMHFEYYKTPEQAIDSVKNGKCDSAWILKDNMDEGIKEFANSSSESRSVAIVVEREENVLLRISREKLSSVLYKYFSRDLYIGYVRDYISEAEHISDGKFFEYYDSFFVENELFEFAYPDGNVTLGTDVGDVNYLVAPIRGLLSILVVLCSMASAMFYLKDNKKGTFSWVPVSKRIYVEFACQLIATANIAVIMLIALAFCGITTSAIREILTLILYIINCALFGMVLRNIFNNINILSALIPLVVTVMIAICPVFFEFKQLRYLQMLFPPTYYINAVNNSNFLKYMVFYAVACIAIISFMNSIRKAVNGGLAKIGA